MGRPVALKARKKINYFNNMNSYGRSFYFLVALKKIFFQWKAA
jgi:hypothetical protein